MTYFLSSDDFIKHFERFVRSRVDISMAKVVNDITTIEKGETSDEPRKTRQKRQYSKKCLKNNRTCQGMRRKTPHLKLLPKINTRANRKSPRVATVVLTMSYRIQIGLLHWRFSFPSIHTFLWKLTTGCPENLRDKYPKYTWISVESSEDHFFVEKNQNLSRFLQPRSRRKVSQGFCGARTPQTGTATHSTNQSITAVRTCPEPSTKKLVN